MTAVTLLPAPATPVGGVVGKSGVTTVLVLQLCCFTGCAVVAAVVLLFSCWFLDRRNPVAGLLVGNHIVDASSLVYLFTLFRCERLLNPFTKRVCGVSYRPISTGQLHESLVLASTSGLSTQWSGWGPLTHKVYGNLISKRASRLDAFSGYPIRT